MYMYVHTYVHICMYARIIEKGEVKATLLVRIKINASRNFGTNRRPVPFSLSHFNRLRQISRE